MKANKFSGTGGLQHWLCASATVAEPCPSSLPWSGGTLPPENPTLGFRNLPLFCTKISQGQKTPSPFSPRIRLLSCLILHLDETRAGRAGKGGTSAGLALALPTAYSHLHRLFLFCRALHPLIHPPNPLTDKVRAQLALEPGAHRGIWCPIQCAI